MEENKKSSSDEKNSSDNTKQNSSSGIDFNGLLNDSNVMEVIKHLLSGGGAMAGTYLMWIKPLQDKIETLTTKSNEQDKRIRVLEDELYSLQEEREDDGKFGGHSGRGKDYFEIGRSNSRKSSKGKYHM